MHQHELRQPVRPEWYERRRHRLQPRHRFAIARTLLQQGASVLINGYSAEETRDALTTLSGQYPAVGGRQRVAAEAGDVSEPAFADELLAGAVRAFGRLDHMVCNAGIDIINRQSTTRVRSGTRSWASICAVHSSRRRPRLGTGSPTVRTVAASR